RRPRAGRVLPATTPATGARGGSSAGARLRLRAPRRPSKLHARPSRLAQADGDRLLRGTGAGLALLNVVHLLAPDLASLGARALALTSIAPRTLDRCLLRHVASPVTRPIARSTRAPGAVRLYWLSRGASHVPAAPRLRRSGPARRPGRPSLGTEPVTQ